MNEKKLINWLARIPKVELHLHLEGAIPYDVLWELVKKYGGDPSVPTLEKLKERFVFRDFRHFLETWGWKNGFIREYDDFTLIAEAVARDLETQNIRYAEIFCTPSDHYNKWLDTQKIITAIRKGFDKVRTTKTNIIVDFCRNAGPESAERDLDAVNEIKNLGIIGFTIGGAEQEFPPQVYKTVYERARNLGFHLSAHAGEAAGPESVWGAIRDLKVERIGHGTRIIEDPALERYVVEHKIPLEVCPISNLRTRVIDIIEAHPVKRYYDRGMIVTINTDDPKMFGNSLVEEYQTLHKLLGFSLPDIQNLILNGIRACWLPLNKKRELERSFLHDPGWIIP
jgi:adenosine deaminase